MPGASPVGTVRFSCRGPLSSGAAIAWAGDMNRAICRRVLDGDEITIRYMAVPADELALHGLNNGMG